MASILSHGVILMAKAGISLLGKMAWCIDKIDYDWQADNIDYHI